MYKSVNQLAEEFGCSRATIHNWCKKLGIGGYSSQYDGRVRLFDEQQQKQLRAAILKENHIPKAE